MKLLTDSKIVEHILESAKRIIAKPKIKKEPLSVDILMSMYLRLYRFKHLKKQRIICACLLGFSGFMRSSEILCVKISDIVFDQNFIAVFIESS